MWKWLRKWFGGGIDAKPISVSINMDEPSESIVKSMEETRPRKFSELRVHPDDPADFDASSCERLLATIESLGAKHINDLQNIAVSLEDFFEGNHCKPSIAANVEPSPPYDTIESWYEHLKKIRERQDVHDVLVDIYMIEPYEDGRVGMWPYADTIWVYSSLERDAVAELMQPLEPDSVEDFSAVDDPEWYKKLPHPPPHGHKPFLIWWD